MQSMSPHPLKAIADAPQQVTLFTAQPTKTTLGCTTPWHRNGTEPLACLDVYVDNIIGLAQTEWLQHVTHWLALHNIDLMFQANHTDEITRKQPISESKLLKGDAQWSTTKTLLSWDVDATNGTMWLPAHQTQCLQSILHDTLAKWHQVASVTQNMVSPAGETAQHGGH